MKAVIKKVVFMGKVGVGIYINGSLSTFIVQAVDLLDNIEALKVMGYEVKMDNEYDETELEDEMVVCEFEETSLMNDWEVNDEH